MPQLCACADASSCRTRRWCQVPALRPGLAPPARRHLQPAILRSHRGGHLRTCPCRPGLPCRRSGCSSPQAGGRLPWEQPLRLQLALARHSQAGAARSLQRLRGRLRQQQLQPRLLSPRLTPCVRSLQPSSRLQSSVQRSASAAQLQHRCRAHEQVHPTVDGLPLTRRKAQLLAGCLARNESCKDDWNMLACLHMRL